MPKTLYNTFLKLIKNISTFKGLSKAKVKPYIFIALRNAIFDIVEQNKKYLSVDMLDETPYIADFVENKVIDKIQVNDIIKKINTLPENDIVILQLTYLIQLKDKQIAKQLDLQISAVKKRRERAKNRLYNMLTKGGILEMMPNEKWEKLLTQALQIDIDAKMSELSSEQDACFEFSEEFESEMHKLLNRASKPCYYFINTVGKRVAVVMSVSQ